MNYEQAVDWLRCQPEHVEAVRSSYLDIDIGAAAQRFAISEEFYEVSGLLRLRSHRRLTVADIGCGNGIASFAIADAGHDVFGIDPDPSSKVGLGAFAGIAPAGRGLMQPISGSAESIPLADHSVDCVYTRQAMHHFSDLSGGLRECARILKPGGLFLGTREHVISDAQERDIFLRDHIMQPLHGCENAFRLVEYTDAIESANLKLLSVIGRFDSIINYYPGTNAARVAELVRWARTRKGAFAGWIVALSSIARKKAARLLSECDRYPGRLYSFLAVKV